MSSLRKFRSLRPLFLSRLFRALYAFVRALRVPKAYADGHYYSPVVNPKELDQIPLWHEPPVCRGVDFNDKRHLEVLTEWFPRYIDDYDYDCPEHSTDDDDAVAGFYTQNSQFSWLDARTLFVFLRHLKPGRVIEVGSGYSSLLMADVNQRYLLGAMKLTCIEPYPRAFLKKGLPGIHSVLEKKVQEVPLDFFAQLEPGDILFIDSSHVAKTGSDVNYLYLQVLPELKPGVHIHIHDVFLPLEYPRDWVMGENRSWNEQYLVHALLMYSHGFRVSFGSSYAKYAFPDQVAKALAFPDARAFGGGSLWLERL